MHDHGTVNSCHFIAALIIIIKYEMCAALKENLPPR